MTEGVLPDVSSNSEIRPDERDEAIIELAHVARELLNGVIDKGEIPASIYGALRNKIEYYASRGRSQEASG